MPSPLPFNKQLEHALAKKEIIILLATCSINYNGRAQSSLACGDRLLIIKPDGTLLVHQPTGSVPINYMKEGTHFHLMQQPNVLLLHAHNPKTKEFMTIELTHIHHFHTQLINDGVKIILHGHEKDMSDMLYAQPHLIEPGLRAVSREEKTAFGFIDVLCYDQQNNLVIIECKRNHADFKAVEQLQRYVKKVKQSKGITNVRGILASPSISANAKTLLEQFGYQHITIDPPYYKEQHRKNQKKIEEY